MDNESIWVKDQQVALGQRKELDRLHSSLVNLGMTSSASDTVALNQKLPYFLE